VARGSCVIPRVTSWSPPFSILNSQFSILYGSVPAVPGSVNPAGSPPARRAGGGAPIHMRKRRISVGQPQRAEQRIAERSGAHQQHSEPKQRRRPGREAPEMSDQRSSVTASSSPVTVPTPNKHGRASLLLRANNVSSRPIEPAKYNAATKRAFSGVSSKGTGITAGTTKPLTPRIRPRRAASTKKMLIHQLSGRCMRKPFALDTVARNCTAARRGS